MLAHIKKCLHYTSDRVHQIEAEYDAYREKHTRWRRPPQSHSGSGSAASSTLAIPTPATSRSPSPYVSVSPAPTTISSAEGPLHKRRRTTSATWDPNARPWPTEIQAEFDADICKLFVGNDWSFNTVGTLRTREFFEKWIGAGVRLPDRRDVAGRLLNQAVEGVHVDIRDAVKGKLATGQNDGWKNIRKSHLVALMFTVLRMPYLTDTRNLSGQRKTGDNLFRIIEQQIRELEGPRYGVEVIGWITDDGPDGKKARRLLLEAHPHLMVLVCWAHQVQL
ncbi:hypothetical protein K488DRAFT_64797, partial [Vararia minispora EC-137]